MATLDVRHLVPRASPQPGGNLRFAAFHLQMFKLTFYGKHFISNVQKSKHFILELKVILFWLVSLGGGTFEMNWIKLKLAGLVVPS